MSAITLQFPLRGQWSALRTPAARVPTHGTDFLGQRYAYDFVRPTDRRWAPFGPSAFAHALPGVPVSQFARWAAPVFAVAAGTVLRAVNDAPDRRWVQAIWDLLRLQVWHRLRPVRITPSDWRALAGNYLIIEGSEGVTFYAHLRRGSLRVGQGDRVAAGTPIGEVGHSGRSGVPHLHFHLMDRGDSVAANGLLCDFHGYEEWHDVTWRPGLGIPGHRTRIRSRLDSTATAAT